MLIPDQPEAATPIPKRENKHFLPGSIFERIQHGARLNPICERSRTQIEPDVQQAVTRANLPLHTCCNQRTNFYSVKCCISFDPRFPKIQQDAAEGPNHQLANRSEGIERQHVSITARFQHSDRSGIVIENGANGNGGETFV